MNYIYYPGDIVLFRYIEFNDGTIDTRLKGHPFIILNGVKEIGDEAKAVMLSSKINRNKKQLPLNPKYTTRPMPKKSFINYDHIYTLTVTNIQRPVNSIKEKYFKVIVDAITN